LLRGNCRAIRSCRRDRRGLLHCRRLHDRRAGHVVRAFDHSAGERAADNHSSGCLAIAAASLDPSQSDAGVVAQVTLANDEAGGRDGIHVVVGVDADGSQGSYSLDGDEFTGVAWDDDAPNGQIHQFSVTVPASAIPDADGQTAAVDGRVSFDFVSESGFGTQYVGDASRDDSGHATIDVMRAGDLMRFDFEGATWNDATFSGTMLCAEASL
jgi:hypothetical protein